MTLYPRLSPHPSLSLMWCLLDLGLQACEFGGEDPRRDPGVEVPLKLQQLAHEVEVGRDHRPAPAHVLVGVCHGHERVLHQVGDDDGGRPRHTRLAVDKHATATLVRLLCREG